MLYASLKSALKHSIGQQTGMLTEDSTLEDSMNLSVLSFSSPVEWEARAIVHADVAHQIIAVVLVLNPFQTKLITTEQAAQMEQERRRSLTGAIIYAWWNGWKDRNQRIFKGVSRDQLQVSCVSPEFSNKSEAKYYVWHCHSASTT
ncbi:hypothetical protein EJB05_17620, partial [Eragrostis curvula]